MQVIDTDAIVTPDEDSVIQILGKFFKYHQLPIIWQNSKHPNVQEALVRYYGTSLNKVLEDQLITKAEITQ